MNFRYSRRLALTALVLSGLASPAFAQSTPSAQTTGPSATRSSHASASLSVLREVIVTAQHRVQNEQKTPVAINVVSGARLKDAGVTDPTGLTQLVPSVQFGKAAGPYYVFFLRGVGSNATNSITDPAISLSLDGVPMARQYNLDGQFYDLQRVEILEGPQGTLYGRNATGGAINLIPNRPTHERSARFDVSVGNYGLFQTTAVMNMPITDTVAARVSAQSVSRTGYLSDGEADDDTKSARGQLLIEPSDSLSIRLSADVVNQGGRGGGSAIVSNGYSADQRIGLGDPAVQALEAAKGLQTVSAQQLFQDNHYYGFMGELKWTVGLGTLTIQPAYRHAALDFVSTFGGLETVIEKDKQKSIEARFASRQTGFLRWVVGALYLDDQVNSNFGINDLNGFGNLQLYASGTKSDAVYADGTASLTRKLRLIAGARYTRDTKTMDGSLHNPYVVNPHYIVVDRSAVFSKVTERAGLQYDVTASSMAYAMVSTGFRSGGFFFTSDNPVFRPETMTAYTVGTKNRFLDDRLQLNAEIFDWQYKDQQLSHVVFDSFGDSIFAVSNAGSTTIRGAEFGVKFLAGSTLMSLDIQYLDSVLDKFSFLQRFPAGATSLCSSTRATGGFTVDCAGATPPESPRWVVNPSIRHSFGLPNGADLDVQLSTHFQSASYTALNFLPSDVQGSYWNTDALITYNSPNDKWSISAFGDNLGNAAIKQFTTHVNFDASQLLAPRTFGLRASFRLR